MSTHSHAQLVKVLASRNTRTSAVALIVAGSLVIHAAPPERFLTALAGGSLGFSLLFAWLFFHSGLRQLPERQRGPFLLVVLLVLSTLLVVQAWAALRLATEVLHSQEPRARHVQGAGGRTGDG
ncbi:hypothetical protein [Archangium violaceum]|uniref:Uncharacterized protein n=1 Tax=Archangium violaceum Cb vi76 TaxID=1406225 RepID=A0A084T116_9BACT|nr:hypothetical protein [Archangium violaceum]KFA94401.1 hypothetical protein Q664_02985 [Archangium violaceum Cb vi76]